MHTPLFNNKMNDLTVATRRVTQISECPVEKDTNNSNMISLLLFSFMLLAMAIQVNIKRKRQPLIENADSDDIQDCTASQSYEDLLSLPEDILSTTMISFFEVGTPSPEEILSSTNQDLFWEICSNEDVWTKVAKAKQTTLLIDEELSSSRCRIF